MSRRMWPLAGLVAGPLLVLALVSGAPAAFAGGGDNPPDWCFRPNANGDLPTCTWNGSSWHRSYDSGMNVVGGGGGGSGGFAALFVLMLVAGIGITVWKVSTARRMASDSGMDPDDATAMTLLSDDGFEATYLASSLRGRVAPPQDAPDTTPVTAPPSVAERLRELASLRDQGLITPEEHDVRRARIIDSV